MCLTIPCRRICKKFVENNFANRGAPQRVLTLFDCVAIVVGIVIGASIFRLPSIVAGQVGDDGLILLVWLLGGVISFIGALCYAELTTAFPSTGGEYHFLTRAFGLRVGFMFTWARMTVIQTGSIAFLAYVFGDYAGQIVPLGIYESSIYAVLAVVTFTWLNIAGVHQTRAVQKVLTSITVLGLVLVVGVGLTHVAQFGPAPAAASANNGFSSAVLGSSLIFVLLTYGGWNEAAYVSAETRGGPRSMAGALFVGIGIITAVYVLVNFIYLKVLGTAAVAASDAIAVDLMEILVGPAGGKLAAALVLVLVLASLNVTIITGARTNYALGRDVAMFAFLGHWSAKSGAPVRALLFQGAISLGLVFLGALNRGGVATMVDYLAPVFWFFFLLIGTSLFVLRSKEPDALRPFRVPLYPLTPALFCLTSAYLLYSSLTYTGFGALVGVLVLAAGMPFLIIARRSFADDEKAAAAATDVPG